MSHNFQQNFYKSHFRRPPHRTIVHQLSAKRAAYPYRGNSSGSTIRCLLAKWWSPSRVNLQLAFSAWHLSCSPDWWKRDSYLAHQVLPMLYLSMVYISGHMKSLVDKEKTSNWEEHLRIEVGPAERARYNPIFFKRAFTELRSETRLIEHRTSITINLSRKYNVLRLCRIAYKHLWELQSNTASCLDIRTPVTLRPARVVHMLRQNCFV